MHWWWIYAHEENEFLLREKPLSKKVAAVIARDNVPYFLQLQNIKKQNRIVGKKIEEMTKINMWSLLSKSMILCWQQGCHTLCKTWRNSESFSFSLYDVYFGYVNFYWSMKAGGGIGNGDELTWSDILPTMTQWFYLVRFMQNLTFWSLRFFMGWL